MVGGLWVGARTLGRLGAMPRAARFRISPPRWVDEEGRFCPTRPGPKCGRVIPIKRVHPATAHVHQWRAWSVATWVEWCGHQVEVVLVPEGGGAYSEIPVLGVAR